MTRWPSVAEIQVWRMPRTWVNTAMAIIAATHHSRTGMSCCGIATSTISRTRNGCPSPISDVAMIMMVTMIMSPWWPANSDRIRRRETGASFSWARSFGSIFLTRSGGGKWGSW